MNKLDFNIDDEFIIKGLKNVVNNTGILGRWQIILNKPNVICDIAHNQEALKIILEQLSLNKFYLSLKLYYECQLIYGILPHSNLH